MGEEGEDPSQACLRRPRQPLSGNCLIKAGTSEGLVAHGLQPTLNTSRTIAALLCVQSNVSKPKVFSKTSCSFAMTLILKFKTGV